MHQFRQRLFKETDKYFRGKDPRDHFPSIESDPSCALASLLDPRFKKLAFSDPALAADAVELLRSEMATVSASQANDSLQEISSPAVPDDDPDDWALTLGPDAEIVVNLQAETQPTDVLDELDEYLKEPNLGRGLCPFKYWATNKLKFPGAHKLARKYLCAPLGSVASERVFKLAKRTVEHRYNLKAENVEMLIFMKYNLRYLNFRY